MKTILFSLFLINTVFSSSQDGFKVIHKAENKIAHKKYNQALELLNKASTMDYGFCGNAWMEAKDKIALNRIIIYEVRGESLKAANELNNSHINFYNGENSDSLKMIHFLKTINKEIIKNQLDSAIKSLAVVDDQYFYSDFSLAVTFSEKPFYISYETMRSIRKKTYITNELNKNIPVLNRFKIAIKNQAFYSLLL